MKKYYEQAYERLLEELSEKHPDKTPEQIEALITYEMIEARAIDIYTTLFDRVYKGWR